MASTTTGPSSWLLLFLFIGTRAAWVQERPVLETRDGNLLISSAKDRNISLLTFGASTVNINDINLVEVSTNAQKAARLVENWEKHILGDLVNEVSQISSNLGTVQQRLASLDFGGDGTTNSTATRPGRPSGDNDYFASSASVGRLSNRVRRVEIALRNLRTKMMKNGCSGTPCSNGGTCISIYDSYQCICPSNWEGPTCSRDVNECENYANTDLGCQNGATCINLPGSYSCSCKAGWFGLHCTTKLNTCEARDSTELCGHGHCIPKAGNVGYTCICEQGWETDGSSPACTKDVNECAGKHPSCSMNPLVPCFNEDGGYRCGGCPAGYSGNGHYCHDINECLVDNGGCSTSPRVECINTIGSWSCGHCPAGYQGDGVSCTYVGLCRINNGGCSPQANCVENSGYVQCNCMAGYHGTGVGPQGCRPGVDVISPCSINPCIHGTCLPNGANFLCQCNRGFTGTHCETEIDPCTPNPCQNGGTCRVHDGLDRRTATCNCTTSFMGPRCETQRQSCSGLYKNPSGTLEYPANGMLYEHGLNCAFVILTNSSLVLNITFTRFDFEKSQNCRFDFLQIHDGQNAGAHQMGRFCGTDLPFGGSFTTTHNAVYLWLRTDSSNAHRGFAITWESVTPRCGGFLTANHGTIVSPGSPGKYPNNRDCRWEVFVSPGKRIQFLFYFVMMEEHPTCDYDYLEINETAGNRDVQLGLYCNHTHPVPLLTSGSSAVLHFHSDGAGTDMGFQLNYATVEGSPGCGGTFTADHDIINSPGYPSNYPPRKICDWKIQLPRGERIRLTWLALDIEDQRTCRFDSVQVFAGPDTDSPVVGRYCGSNLPSSTIIDSNVALIVFKSDMSYQRPGFQLKYETVCGGVFRDPTGILKSPYYPQEYPSARTCIYEIIQPPGKGIVLSIVDLEIEGPYGSTCYFDHLKVYDGDNENSTLLGTLCGGPRKIPSEPYISTHNYMFLKFSTDRTGQNRGFLANYTTIDRRCGGLLKEPSGLIRSHAVGDMYSDNEDCTWTLKAPKGNVVQLSFTTFSLEGGSSCGSDYVLVYDTSMNNQEMGRFCGSSLPPTLTSQGESMTIKFHSDFSVSREGFIAHYVFIDTTKFCGGHFFTTTGVITSPNYPGKYPPNKICTWIITAPQKKLITLEVNQFDLESLHTCNFDSLEIRNGASEHSPLIGTYCGTTIPRRIKSLTHEIYLKFVTDSSRQMGGFNISWDSSTYGCGGVVSGAKGEIASPGYPQPYSHRANCLWTIAVSAGSKVQLMILDFNLEDHSRCRYDYIEISLGADEHRKKGTRYCGENHPTLMVLDSNLASVRFVSDQSNSGRGFRIKYETLCQTKVRGFNGVIESPNFPNTYPNYANCTWIIEAPKGNKVNLTFSNFEIEDHSWDRNNCTFDYLVIREGEDDVPNTDLGKFCGTELPGTISSTTNQVFVHFRTDSYIGHGGFRLEWIVVGCGGHLTRPTGEFASPGYPNAYPENIECEWLIDVDFDHSVEITFSDVSTEKSEGCRFDQILVYGGADQNAPKLAQLCHSDSPVVYTSSTNKMFVKFSSDFSNAARGFKAQYKSVDIKCGGTFRAPKGVIHSANYPNNYPHNQNCEWLITVDPNHLVNLTFSEFDLEDTRNCTDDYVQVFDGASRDDMLLGKFCKAEKPPPIVSTGNTILVVMRSDSLVTAKGFEAQFKTACGARIVTDGVGTLETTSLPDIAQDYELNCTWTIISKDPANHVTLNFFHMEVAQENDYDCDSLYLQVYDGDGIDGPSRGQWCSNKAPPSITSNGYALTIHLYSSYGYVDSTFGATYSVLDSACGGEYLSASGAFASPNYPENYPSNSTCIWLLKTSPGNRISLTFSAFELEQSPNCNRDSLEIRENSGIGKLIGTYCTDLPAPIESSEKLWIKFKSDELGSAKGFRADYTFVHGSELTGIGGEIASPLYPRVWRSSDDIYWRITVDYGMAIRVEFDVVHIEVAYGDCLSQVTVYDGYDTNAPVLSTVCGMMPPEAAITSSSNVMYLVFSSGWVRDGNLFHLNWYQMPRETTSGTQEIRVSGCEVEYDLTAFDNNSVVISSPGYPDGYDDNLDCTWVVTTLPGSHLNMRFTQVDFEETSNCIKDYATVYKGNGLISTLDDSNRIARVCRSNDTHLTYSAETVMTVKFHSDYYNNGSGFRAYVWRECGGELSGSNGVIDFNVTKRIQEWRSTLRCEWNITVRQGKTIEVTFTNFKIVNPDAGCKNNYVLLKNGAGPESPLLGTGKYCGIRAPSDLLLTTGNKLYVKAVGAAAQTNFKMTWREKGMNCGGSFRVGETEDQMQFNTPNYPNIPPPFSECFWTFLAPTGGRLSLHFIERFDLTSSPNCTREYVEVRDGGTEHSILLGRFCRDAAPSTLTSTGNMLYVHFYSEVHDPKNGFRASVTTGEVCGGILRGSTGIVRSPNYPSTYPISQDCIWWIDGPPDHTLKLEFRDLHMPSQRQCESGDYVSVGERLTFNDTVHKFGSYCGTRKPGLLETDANEAIVSFHGANRNAAYYRGFVLNYTASKEICGGELSELSAEFKSASYPNPIVNTRYCEWRITVPEGSQVVLEILDLDIMEGHSNRDFSFYLAIYNDRSSQSMNALIRKSPYPKKIYSTSRYMIVRFYHTEGHRGLRARYYAASPVPCGGSTIESSGALNPPAHPYNSTTFFCEWTLKAPSMTLGSPNITSTTLTLSISGMFGGPHQKSLICDYRTKSIRVHDGQDKLGIFCGDITETTITVRSPAPIVTIGILNGTTGGPINFDVKYEWKACGGILVGPSHTIRSPENLSYPKSCVWHAKYEDPAAVIRLSFNRMDLGSCDKGFIIVRNGGPLSPQVGKYCGNIKPGNITSSHNQLWIEYWASQAPGIFEIQLDLASGSCGGTIRGTNKEIFSPGFPINYPNNAECTWEIIAEPGHSVGLVFVDRFNLEASDGCMHDFVQISDWVYDSKGIGAWKEQPKLCGRNSPPVYNATTNRLKVLFRSNNAIQGDGFRAIWEENCGGILEVMNREQFIESPNYPMGYPGNKVCNWTITAPEGKRIWLEFLDFQTEGRIGNCKYDNFTITYRQYSERVSVWCGDNTPPTIYANDKINIIFKSDSYISKRGFRFKFFLNECGGEITEPKEIAQPILKNGQYFSHLNCTWIIRAPEGKSVVLRFSQFELESSYRCTYDQVIVTEGNSLSGPKLAKLCGNVSEPFPIRSVGNVMTVMFRSDGSNHFKGMKASIIFTNSIASGCGGTINLEGSKTFRTQKTAMYENFQDCQWSITTTVGKMIRLTINTIDLKNKVNSTHPGCNGDYLVVRDGAGPFSDFIGQYCGNTPIPPIESTMNGLWIRFYTDGSVVGEGVTATLEAINSPCGKTVWDITNQTQVMQSPGYPGDYTAGIQCRWIFKYQGSSYAQLRVHFEELDIEDSQDCAGDHFEISDEVGRYISQDFGEDFVYNGKMNRRRGRYGNVGTFTYCGKMDPFDYHSGSSEIHVVLKTNALNLPKPRKFKFEVEKASCSRNYTAEQGRIIHQDFEECWTTITAKPNQTISLYFYHFQMYDGGNCSQTFLKVYQGDFKSANPTTLCSTMDPNPIFSTGNKLSLRSRIDMIEGYGGESYDILYTTTDKGRGCGGKLFNYEGSFTSPMYPMNYRNDSMCEWEISVPTGYQVSLEFSHFDLGTSDICSTDYMEIVERNTNEGRSEMYCPGQTPATFRAATNVVTVKYVSSVNNGGTGWVIFFKAIHRSDISASYTYHGTSWRNGILEI